MTREPAPATLDEIREIGRRRRLSPMGTLPNWHQPDGYPRRGDEWAAEHVVQVETCRRFLRSPDRPSYKRAQSSYFLKHEVERWRHAAGDHAYVTNGSLIIAAWLEGLKPRRIGTSPNAMIMLPKQFLRHATEGRFA